MSNYTKLSHTDKVGIFLHMGPGFNAQIEKKLLQSTHPNIIYWDQPKISEPSAAFSKLIEATHERIQSLYKKNNNQPVHLVAHSFGGHLAHQLILKFPELIASCDFYSTGYNIPEGFLKLLTNIGNSPDTNADLKNEIQTFLTTYKKTGNPNQDTWSYISLIVKDPAFNKYYWPTGELFQKYVNFASAVEPLDMASFQNILSDFLNSEFHPERPKASKWSGQINIYLGEKDPLINTTSETSIWNKIFPQAKFHILKDSGHFIHLENILSMNE